jgi:hypothetical protein
MSLAGHDVAIRLLNPVTNLTRLGWQHETTAINDQLSTILLRLYNRALLRESEPSFQLFFRVATSLIEL